MRGKEFGSNLALCAFSLIREHRFRCVIQMHLRLERKIPESADADIDQAERRVIDADVTAALGAIAAVYA
jgi:hypothetical protein